MSLRHQLFLQCLRETGELTQADFDAYRAPLLGALLGHVSREVPYYRPRFAPYAAGAGFDLGRWIEIPVLRIENVRESRASLTADKISPPADAVDEPSQVLGLPPVARSSLARIAAECERERAYESNGLDLGAALGVLHPDHTNGPSEGRGWSITFPKGKWFAGHPQADARNQFWWLRQTGAKLLRTTTDVALRLARFAAAGDEPPAINAVIVADSALPAAARGEIERALRVPVIHIAEHPLLGVVAASAPQGGYTVACSSAVVEVLGADGRPAPSGASGELTLTPLYEYALPLLRFGTGIPAVAPSGQETLLGVRSLSRAGA